MLSVLNNAILLSAFRAGITATIRINTVRLGRAGGQLRAQDQNSIAGETAGASCGRPSARTCAGAAAALTITTATDCDCFCDFVQDAYSTM